MRIQAMLNKTTILTLGVQFILSSMVFAQSLETYQEEAAMNNPELRSAYLNYRAALERSPQVSALPDPEVGFMYFISPIETRLGPQRARFSVSQMFPWFGTLGAKELAANSQAKSAFEAFREQRNQLFYRMESIWADLYEIEKAIEVANENLMIVNTLVELALRRYENGLVSQVDVLRAQIEQEDLKTNLALLVDNRSVLINRMNSLRNAGCNAEIETPTELPISEPMFTDDQLMAQVFAENPNLERIRYNESEQKSKLVVAQKSGAPSFGVGLDYIATSKRTDVANLADNGRDAIIAMASIKIPLYSKKYNAQVREAEIQQRSIAQNLQAVENQLTTDLYAALRDEADARRRFELYDITQIQRVEQALNILMKSYSADNTQFEEILRLQRKLYDYQLKRIQARADLYDAQKYIGYLTGKHNIASQNINTDYKNYEN